MALIAVQLDDKTQNNGFKHTHVALTTGYITINTNGQYVGSSATREAFLAGTSRNIGHITPTIIYFDYQKMYVQDQRNFKSNEFHFEKSFTVCNQHESSASGATGNSGKDTRARIYALLGSEFF